MDLEIKKSLLRNFCDKKFYQEVNIFKLGLQKYLIALCIKLIVLFAQEQKNVFALDYEVMLYGYAFTQYSVISVKKQARCITPRKGQYSVRIVVRFQKQMLILNWKDNKWISNVIIYNNRKVQICNQYFIDRSYMMLHI